MILGDRREYEGWLPAIFIGFARKWEPPLHAPPALLEAKRIGAHGIRLYLNLSFGRGAAWVRLPDEEWPLEENIYGSSQYGVTVMLVVEEHDDLDAKDLAYLFRRLPDMLGRVLVVSSSPTFLFVLRGQRQENREGAGLATMLLGLRRREVHETTQRKAPLAPVGDRRRLAVRVLLRVGPADSSVHGFGRGGRLEHGELPLRPLLERAGRACPGGGVGRPGRARLSSSSSPRPHRCPLH